MAYPWASLSSLSETNLPSRYGDDNDLPSLSSGYKIDLEEFELQKALQESVRTSSLNNSGEKSIPTKEKPLSDREEIELISSLAQQEFYEQNPQEALASLPHQVTENTILLCIR